MTITIEINETQADILVSRIRASGMCTPLEENWCASWSPPGSARSRNLTPKTKEWVPDNAFCERAR
ncbi:MAG TPA: hypothetical protein VFF11_12125 [Candidatus Binatia bacterium]|nr:hypothetical protein [Candidatus Binatia bacterium]